MPRMTPSICRPTAVDYHGGTGHQSRSIAREIDNGAGHIFDPPEPTEFDLSEDAVAEIRIFEERLRHRRLDEGRGDGVDPDTMRPKANLHPLPQPFHPPFPCHAHHP